MTTFAQIVDGYALNVVVGDNLAETLAQCFVAGFDGGHPGVEWEVVPDGTCSSARSNGDGTFTNQLVEAPSDVLPVDPLAALQKQIDVLTKAIAASSPDAAVVIDAALIEAKKDG